MKKFTALTIITITVLSSFSYAHDGATGVIKQRMDMMGEIAKAMKSIGQMVKGEVEYNAEIATKSALEIEKHSQGLLQLFPKGSTTKPSEALPVIWEDWDEFNQLLGEMKAQSKSLAEIAPTAKTSDKIKAQFASVGKTCGTCHKKFRQQK